MKCRLFIFDRCRNSLGDIPVNFLMALKKVVLELNPASVAIPSIVRLFHAGLEKLWEICFILFWLMKSLNFKPYTLFNKADK